ncbi:MAG TPA: trypsin-like peptidase domain-containing protein [Trebonia sp.]
MSQRIVAVVAGAAFAVGAPALAPQARAAARPGHPAGVPVLQDAVSTVAQAATVRYWTEARMAAALRAANGGPTTVKPTTARAPGVAASAPALRAVKARREVPEPISRKRHLVKRAQPKSPAPSGPWLTGNTVGQGLRWTHGGAVTDAVGKVFFTLGDADYVCSGTLVGGKQADVVLTAAHCVTSGPGQGDVTRWATNWMFVPGFTNGLMPDGEYTARRFFATPDWTGPAGGSEQYDVAFVQVTTATPDGVAGLARPPAGLPVKFAESQGTMPAVRAYVFGYPSEPPYSGLYLTYCAGSVAAVDGSLRTACGMTAGDSGGPWLAGFSPRSGTGTVVAVCTYKVSDNLRVLYGAALGPQARALYQRAVSSAR